jgi:dihydrofolate reductase
MIICAIAAMAKNRVIGVNNQLPWHLPKDLAFFKQKTKGSTIIMGRKTFESLGKPLPHRHHIVLSRSAFELPAGVDGASNLEEALKRAQEISKSADEEVFIIGGAEIYRQSMPLWNRLYLTVINLEPQGDAYFPEVDWEKDFKLVHEEHCEENGIQFAFLLGDRK